MSNKDHVSSVFHPVLCPVPFTRVQVSPKLQNLLLLLLYSCWILFGAHSTPKPTCVLVLWQAVAAFCPRIRAAITVHGSDVRSSLKQVSNHFFKLLLGQLVGASVSCWLLLQFYSLFIHGGLPIRQFYVLGTKNKCWSKSLPNDHTTLNNFRSLITEEIIRRNV